MRFSSLFTYVVFLFLFVSCKEKKEIKIGQVALIPQPKELTNGVGFYELNEHVFVSVEDKVQEDIANQFFNDFEQICGWSPKVYINNKDASIVFSTDASLPPEAYELYVKSDEIQIKASQGAGFFYALQSMKQLLPSSFHGTKALENVVWHIPEITIKDNPAFKWRGYMLDVSRHFFDKEDVKRVLDFMAEAKLNRFHWHLSDDQGWRLEIKKYPKLTDIGAWRVDRNTADETVSNWWGRPVQSEGEKATYGGFYTQEDIKEIVAYAKQRYIEIIPELDMPGHALAAIASYPEISCSGESTFVGTGGVNKDNTLCPGKEITFEFVEGVIDELAQLFPFEYIHIGGDECNKLNWEKDPDCQQRMQEEGLSNEEELQSYFVKRVERMVNKRNKRLIGWDEILEGGLAPNATVMSWRGEKGGIQAARQGHDVIMTPSRYTYLDLKQGDDDLEPNLGYGYTFLKDTYNYKIISDSLTVEQGKHVLGLQGNLWTESISDWEKLTYMTFPRLYAIAENGWCGEANKDWTRFTECLPILFKRLDAKNVRYATSAYNVKIRHQGTQKGTIKVWLKTEVDSLQIRYTLDNSEPNITSEIYKDTLHLDTTVTLKATSFKNEKQIGNISKQHFPLHKGFGAKVIYHAPKIPEEHQRQLVDLNYGILNRWNQRWQRINGDLEVDLLFDKPTTVKAVEASSLRFTIGGVYLPERIEVYGSTDNKTFTKLKVVEQLDESHTQGRNKVTTRVNFDKTTVISLKIKAKRVNPIPKGHHQAGNPSKIQIDELMVY